MGDAEAIEQYQRWLQARLSIAEQIEDPAEKDRTTKQIESAIQLSIKYRQIVSEGVEEIPSPFVHRDSPVRLVEDERSLALWFPMHRYVGTVRKRLAMTWTSVRHVVSTANHSSSSQ